MGPETRALMALARAKAAKKKQHRDSALLALLIAWLGSKAAVGVSSFPPDLSAALTRGGFDPAAVAAIGEKLLSRPLSGRTRHGAPASYNGMPATRLVAAGEPKMRAQYILAALERLTEARAEGRYDQALNVEQNYLDAHVAAGRNRRRAARRVDELAPDEGQLLVWRTAGDSRVEATCRSLEGRLFRASNPPDGLIPGAVHPRCRCTAQRWGGVYIPIS